LLTVDCEGIHQKRMTNDEVHSRICLDPVTSAFLSTPPLQRLRQLTQLGVAHHVYINANHSRFEHSLGVSHLAEKLCKSIKQQQPQLKCTDKDVLCVKLAGLMHDLGHGPYSHVFEDFVQNLLPEYLRENPHLQKKYEGLPQLPPDWCHENVSLMMIDSALEYLGLRINYKRLDEPLEQIGYGPGHILNTSFRAFSSEMSEEESVLTSRDMIFVKECVVGEPIADVQRDTGMSEGFVGRPDSHSGWMYDIVCNDHSGLDVDKIDYFARDKRRCKRDSGEISMLLIDEAFVAWGDCSKSFGKCARCNDKGEHLMICYPQKVIPHALDFFRMRHTLHEEIYQHKCVTATAYMVKDILCLADPHMFISAKPYPYPNAVQSDGGRQGGILSRLKREYDALPMSRAMMDVNCVLQMEDNVMTLISNSTDPELNEARLLLGRFKCRDFYKCVGKIPLAMNDEGDAMMWSRSVSEMKKSFLLVIKTYAGEKYTDEYGDEMEMKDGDVIIEKQTIHYGKKKENPLTGMRFLSKHCMNQLSNAVDKLPRAVDHSQLAPPPYTPLSFQNNAIRVFSTNSAKHKFITHMFEQWRESLPECLLGENRRASYCLSAMVQRGAPIAQREAPMLLSQDSYDEHNEYEEGGGHDGSNVSSNDEEGVECEYVPLNQSMLVEMNQITPTRTHSREEWP
jgi:deoxynucleoside triphosphate triphosphohydrolase SAMHD1